MTLKLVSSGDDRALAIRDHALQLIRGRGALETQRGGPVRVVALETGPWRFEGIVNLVGYRARSTTR